MQQCIDHIGIKIKETKKRLLESPQSKSCFSPQILYSDAKMMILKPKSHHALLLLTTWQLLLITHSEMWMDLGGYLPSHLPPATVSFIFHFSCVGLIPVSRMDTSQEETTCGKPTSASSLLFNFLTTRLLNTCPNWSSWNDSQNFYSIGLFRSSH